MAWVALLVWLLHAISMTTSELIAPTFINDTTTHERYIASSSASKSFADSSIECGYNSICTILCDITRNCSNLQINAAAATQLTLNCSQHASCQSIQLLHGPSHSLNIHCMASRACLYGTFHAPLTSIVHVTCNHTKACQHAQFNLAYSNSTDIECGASALDDCMFSTFNLSHANHVTFSNPHQHTSILAPVLDDASFTIHCNTSCSAAQIYLSSRTVPSINVLCAAYSSPASSCDYMQFYCSDLDTILPTNHLFVADLSDFRCDSDGCCPPRLSTMNASFTWNCTKLLGDECKLNYPQDKRWPYNEIIDASKAINLTYICNTAYECQHVGVRCPHQAECSLLCSEQASCEYVHVLPATVSSLHIECLAAYSCRGMRINVSVTQSVNITCRAAFACSLMTVAVDGIADKAHVTLHALQEHAAMDMNITIRNSDLFTMSCFGTGSCRNVYLSSHKTNTFSVLADSFGSNHTFENVIITHECGEKTKVESCGMDIMFNCGSDTNLETRNCTQTCTNVYNANAMVVLPFDEATQTWQTCGDTIVRTTSRPPVGLIMIIGMVTLMIFICLCLACCWLCCNKKEKRTDIRRKRTLTDAQNGEANVPPERVASLSMAQLNQMAFRGAPSEPPLVEKADESDSDDIYVDHAAAAGEEKKEEAEIVNAAEDGPLQAWMINVVQLPQYINVFIRNDIGLEVMPEVDRSVLKEVGITSVGHQMTIIKHAKQLNLRDMGYSEGPKGPMLKSTMSSTFQHIEADDGNDIVNGHQDEDADLEKLLEQDEQIVGDDEKETEDAGGDELIIGSDDHLPTIQ